MKNKFFDLINNQYGNSFAELSYQQNEEFQKVRKKKIFKNLKEINLKLV